MRLPVEMSESQFTEELVAGKRDGKIQMRCNNFQVFFFPFPCKQCLLTAVLCLARYVAHTGRS